MTKQHADQSIKNHQKKGKKPSPTMFVIFASKSPVAVIIRRGPSRWAHIIKWNTTKDTFENGAWIKGRIYSEACDISPNGEFFLYSVHQGNKIGTSYRDCWTAVSELPWLQAIALWPMGTTYGGGGRFVTRDEIIIRSATGDPVLHHPNHPPTRFNILFGAPPYHESSREIAGSDWCGRDQNGRMIYTMGGLLVLNNPAKDKDDIVLADFTECIPDPKPSPAALSAKRFKEKKFGKKTKPQ